MGRVKGAKEYGGCPGRAGCRDVEDAVPTAPSEEDIETKHESWFSPSVVTGICDATRGGIVDDALSVDRHYQ